MPAQAPPDNCTYQSCALAIEARLTGLSVVRGSPPARVTTLSFFLPHTVAPAFAGTRVAGSDSATAWATRATSRRRWAATFTDVGIVVGAAGAVTARRRSKVDATSLALLATGGASFAVSVPLQFSADNALSRAVWWFNRRFAP